MNDLVEKLNAEDGSRELDALVHKEFGKPDAYNWQQHFIGPHYTTSIDAALTLVPEWGADH